MATAEFSMPLPYHSDRRGPVRWIFSHAVRKWPFWIILMVGAFGNAGLLALVQTTVGQAFNLVLSKSPNLNQLLGLAVLIGVTALLRGLLQFGRNFGSELLAQKIERDVRNELYVSLLGKSMTFHSLQPL